ncbi:MAG: cob(I)yrinic acid a,c-diamide adenosyltransferase [Ignavibacteria bacterium]
MKIYTKTGDKGETSLLTGERVPKNSQIIEAYGTIDELNSFIGLAIAEAENKEIKQLLKKIQNQLFLVGADLASPDKKGNKKLEEFRIPKEFYLEAEEAIDHFESSLEELKNFILPGGSKSSGLLHLCRTIARRAEREVVAVKENINVEENILIFLNRLSDLFFVLARYENKTSGIPDAIWKK